MSRISDLEDRIAELEKYIDLMNEENGEVDSYLIEDLEEAKANLRFAWAENEAEYDYAIERQEFNADGSLVY